MVIPEIKQERLYQKIANLIIKLINDNIFPPGSFLPPERELAKQLAVSRSSLRETLIALEISGWITMQSGNGVIVSDKTHSSSNYITIIISSNVMPRCFLTFKYFSG